VRETNDLIVVTADHRELALLGLGKSPSPHFSAIGHDVPVQVGIQVGTSVMTAPAVGMEGGNGVGIAVGPFEVLHSKDLSRHVGLLIDPGIGTVHQPAAGPSTGQVPQVTLDERSENIRIA
jgi:hypothetical protein